MLLEQRKSIQKIISREFGTKDIDYIKALKQILVADGKFTIDSFQALRVNSSYVHSLSDEELCLISQAIVAVKPSAFNISDYFTPTDILQASRYFNNPESSEHFLVFTNAAMLGRNQWSAIASVKQIAMLKKHNLIRVDPNLQRQSMVRKTPEVDDILKRVFVNPRRVDEIATKIAKDSYHYNTVRLNVMVSDNSVAPVFDEDKHAISIDANNDIIIPDGHHRILAAEKAYYDNTNLSELFEARYFQVVITYYSPKEVRDTIYQEWNTQPVPKQHKDSMSSSGAATIINMIRSNENADELYTKAIVTTNAEVRAGVGFISYELFTRALDKYFYAENNQSRAFFSSTASWLVEYYNYVVDKFSKVFSSPRDSSNWLVTPWGWYGITCFASMIKGDSRWVEITDKALDMVDWHDMTIIEGSKSEVEINILKLFKEVCCLSVQQ